MDEESSKEKCLNSHLHSEEVEGQHKREADHRNDDSQPEKRKQIHIN